MVKAIVSVIWLTFIFWKTAAADDKLCHKEDLPVKIHGKYNYKGVSKFAVGTRLNIICDLGYESRGYVFVQCEEEGLWSRIWGGNCYKRYIGVGYGNFTSFHEAARDGNLKEVKRMANAGVNLSAKADPDSDGGSAIHLASSMGHLNIVKFLLSVDPSLEWDRSILYGSIPLHDAAVNGQLHVVKYFINIVGTSLEATDWTFNRTALHRACWRNHLNVVKWLVSNNANVAAKSNSYDYQFTPIHIAALYGHTEIVKYFIKHNSSMAYWTSAAGLIPMHTGTYSDSIPVVSFFIFDVKVDIEEKDGKYGKTALHYATQYRYLDLVKWLVEAGADVYAVSNEIDSKMYPIHIAAQVGNLAIVKYFVEINPTLLNVTDIAGRTPLNYAEHCRLPGCKEVTMYLKSKHTEMLTKPNTTSTPVFTSIRTPNPSLTTFPITTPSSKTYPSAGPSPTQIPTRSPSSSPISNDDNSHVLNGQRYSKSLQILQFVVIFALPIIFK